MGFVPIVGVVVMGFMPIVGVVVMGFVADSGCCCDGFFFFFFFFLGGGDWQWVTGATVEAMEVAVGLDNVVFVYHYFSKLFILF